MSKKKPNFLIIGAPRCGTTYLARNLASHPEVFLTTGDNDDNAGDVHFFDANTEQGRRNLEKGTAWYFDLFSGAGKAKAIGEKTADYLVDPDAPSLIANTLGDPRIVVMIRDPVERAWSHFCHSRHRLPSHLTFDDLVRQGTDVANVPILKAGLYARQLQSYFQYFSPENILVLVKEDLERAPGAELARLCSFLGVSPDYSFPYIDTYVNASSISRLATITARTGRILKTRLPRTYTALLRGPFSGPVAILVRILRGKTDYRHTRNKHSTNTLLDLELRQRLQDYYRSDVHEMSQLMKRNLHYLWWDGDTSRN